jgi:hypothetical protein
VLDTLSDLVANIEIRPIKTGYTVNDKYIDWKKNSQNAKNEAKRKNCRKLRNLLEGTIDKARSSTLRTYMAR